MKGQILGIQGYDIVKLILLLVALLVISLVVISVISAGSSFIQNLFNPG